MDLVSECCRRSYLYVVVKFGALYSNGLGGWVPELRRAFKFTDANGGPHACAICWARAVARTAMPPLVKSEPRAKARVVLVVAKRKAGAAP